MLGWDEGWELSYGPRRRGVKHEQIEFIDLIYIPQVAPPLDSTVFKCILEDRVTSHIFASLCLISCGCYAHADNKSRQRRQTNPQRRHTGACGS